MEVSVNKRQKNLSRKDLETLEKSELIDKIIQLQAYNIQLKNILQKKLDDESVDRPQGDESVEKSKRLQRKFDFDKSSKRHVLLKFLYFGWDYHGLACQEDSNATIEYHIFKSLTRTCLIQSRDTSNYHRCGRTDKEVSAFCQVISIDLRSKFREELQLTPEALQNEIDYCGLLNKVLPKNIQCIAWMPLRSKEYSARFDCKKRTYRYFFPTGNLNLPAMQAGCELLSKPEGADFRNLCKMDVHNGVMNYKRKIYSATINECPNQIEEDSFKMCYLEIEANSFLWHQIRCIVSVLLLIGEGNEEPKVIEDLLDVSTNPCKRIRHDITARVFEQKLKSLIEFIVKSQVFGEVKNWMYFIEWQKPGLPHAHILIRKPQYTPAAAFPLNLYNCEFRKVTGQTKFNDQNDDQPFDDEQKETEAACDLTNWVYNEENLSKLIETIQGEWTKQSVRSFMMRSVLGNLEDLMKQHFRECNVKAQANILHECVKRKQYQKLMSRKRCESLENRVHHFVKKQRLVVKDS